MRDHRLGARDPAVRGCDLGGDGEPQAGTGAPRRAPALASDLAGIYFAVQASYEQQVIDSNQQALNAAVREYKADYAKELGKLPELLRTTPSAPALPQGPRPA